MGNRTIGELFEERRLKMGWSPAQVSAKSGVSKATYSLISRGRTTSPDPDTAMAIAEVLDISPEVVAMYLLKRPVDLDRFDQKTQQLAMKIQELPPGRRELIESMVDQL